MKKQYMNYMKSCLLVMIACLVSMVERHRASLPPLWNN